MGLTNLTTKSRFHYLFVIFICVLTAFLLFWGQLLNVAKAEDFSSISPRVTVSPAKFDLTGFRGETIKNSVIVTNEDSFESILALSIEGIGITSEDGDVVLGAGYPNYLSQWTTFSEKGSHFKPHESKIISFEIKIPNNADMGGKYGALVVSMDRVNRNLSEGYAQAKVVSFIMLTLAGGFSDQAESMSFEAENHSGNEIEFLFRVRNLGIAHIHPKGRIVLTNLWGKKISETIFEGENVLPGMTRKMYSTLPVKKSLFGFYTATVVVNYGQTNSETLTAVDRFFRFDRKIGIPILIILIFVLGGYYIVIKKKKRR